MVPDGLRYPSIELHHCHLRTARAKSRSASAPHPRAPLPRAGHGTSAADLLSLLRSLHAHALSQPPTHLALLAWGAAPFLPKLAPGDAAALAGELEGWAEGEEVAAARAAAEEEGEEGDEEAWAPFDTYLKMVKVGLRGAEWRGRGGCTG